MKSCFINLNNREDRKEHIEKNIKSINFFKDLERLEAVFENRGDIGCCMSHIKALEKFKDSEYLMILEDDFFIFDNNNFNLFLEDFIKIKSKTIWDIIVLTPRGKTTQKNILYNFNRLNDNQTATGYIIKKNFIPILLKSFKESLQSLKENKNPNLWALDQHWKNLQDKYIFLYYHKIFAGQIESYSDIEKRKVNYNNRFKDQIKY